MKTVDFNTSLQRLSHVDRNVGVRLLEELYQVHTTDAGKVFVVEIMSFTLPDALSHSSEVTYFTTSDAVTHISNIQC